MKLFLPLLFVLYVTNVSAQDFVKTSDGRMFWTDIDAKSFDDKDFIVVEDDNQNIRISKSDIVLVEFKEEGLVILQKDKIKPISPKAFSGELDFFNKGKHVYVPISSFKSEQRYGSARLRENIMAHGYWEIACCEEEADFILKYIFDEQGSDRAFLLFSDRFKKEIMYTPSEKTNSSMWDQKENAEVAADQLYDKYVINGISKGKYKKLKVSPRRRR